MVKKRENFEVNFFYRNFDVRHALLQDTDFESALR